MQRPVSRSRIVELSLCAALAAACTDQASVPDQQGALRGEVVSYLLDFDDHAERQHLLRLPSGEEKRLILPAGTELLPGASIRVWGQDLGQDFAVTRFEADEPAVEGHRGALINGRKKPPRRWAFVLVDTGGGVNLTKEMAFERLFSTTNPKSMKNYYKEISFGLQDLDGEVFGPIQYTPASACDSSGVARALRPMIQGTFDQYLWYFGSRQQCGWAGLAALGTADRPQRDSWYNASSGCVVLAQEPGHNFGMVHSSSLACTNSAGMKMPFALPGGGTCIHSEYGNPFDPMGGGNTCYHMDGFQKAYQDWLAGCNVVKVTQSGTFTLFPLEKACNGVQLLQIPFGENRMYALQNGPMVSISNYYLELRAPIGVDTPLGTRVFVTVGGNIAEARGRGGRNWLLDMTNETVTKNDAQLPVGRTYKDPNPNGPSFTVLSADATKAIIKVDLGDAEGAASEQPGAGLCDDGSMFMAPGPDTCEAPPASSPAPDGGARLDAMASTPARDAGGAGGAAGSAGGTGGAPGGGGGSGGSVKLDGGVVTPKPPADAQIVNGEVDAGEEPPDALGAIKGGCACEVGGRSEGPGAALLLLGLAILVARRRRSP